MKKLNILALVALTFFLGGCQNMLKTMVAHVRIDNNQTFKIAKANAYTNVCLSEKMVNRQHAFEFSTIAAQMLDLVVFDNNFYKESYEGNFAIAYESSKQKTIANDCKSLDENLPEMTAALGRAYSSYARDLNIARSEENQRLTNSMSNFQLPNTPIPQLNFPSVRYSQEQSQTQNFLVKTNSGLTQCRLAKSNFVFCL